MLLILTYISLISGGLLILMLLLGIVGGLDLDVDVDADLESDSDPGVGGVGLVKGSLTFLSIGAWSMRLMLITSSNPILSLLFGAVVGAFAVYLLSLVLTWLLDQEADVNWSVEDAISQPATVYLRIPRGGEGIVKVELKGGMRELKARSLQAVDIPTGALVTVEDHTPEGILLVMPSTDPI